MVEIYEIPVHGLRKCGPINFLRLEKGKSYFRVPQKKIGPPQDEKTKGKDN